MATEVKQDNNRMIWFNLEQERIGKIISIGAIGAALISIVGIFLPWYHLARVDFNITGTDFYVQNEVAYLIVMIVSTLVSVALQLWRQGKQEIVQAIVALVLSIATLMFHLFLVGIVATHAYTTATPTIPELDVLSFGFLMILLGQAGLVTMGIANLILVLVRVFSETILTIIKKND